MKVTFALVAALAAFVAAKPIKECKAHASKGTDVSGWDQGSDNSSSKPSNEKPTNEKPSNEKPADDKNNSGSGAVCPADNGKVLAAGGTCQCEYQINCDVKATPGADSMFWEHKSGELIGSLAECNKLCDDNDQCEATLWVDDPTSAEYHHCWQTRNLGPTTGTGVARISYKESCKGGCTESYSAKG